MFIRFRMALRAVNCSYEDRVPCLGHCLPQPASARQQDPGFSEMNHDSMSVQYLLQDVHVQKSAEFAPDLSQRAYENEARAFVEMKALLAGLRHEGDKRMEPQSAPLLDNRFL